MITIKENAVVIEYRVYGNNNPIEAFLRMRYQIEQLLLNNDIDPEIKRYELISFLDQTSICGLEELNEICTLAKKYKTTDLFK